MLGNATNPNLPPKTVIVKEPYGDHNLISSEDYLVLINRLNEFADNTFTFGESILKKMEESGINDKLKTTADRIANKSVEFSNTFLKKTRDSITSMNTGSRVSVLKDKASDKISSIGRGIWGVIFYSINNVSSILEVPL